MKIDIIGAGIGGLTSALALEQKGFEVHLYEQANEMKTVGAGIILASNALQVYRHLGYYEELRKLGNRISSLHVTTPDLNPMSSIYLEQFEKKYKLTNIAIHRADLQGLLLSKLKTTTLRTNKKLVEIKNGKNLVLHFEDGSEYPANYLIGADGINSVVRKTIGLDQPIRKAKQICWRGVVDFQLQNDFRHKFHEAWGRGSRFGFGQINERQVYWFALLNYKDSIREYDALEWKYNFDNYHPVIVKLLEQTYNHQIFLAEITDLPLLKTWHKGNICLLGDAAHAMTPNMGQGACQSIEDAWAISNCLEKQQPLDAFVTFEKSRMKKVKRIVTASWNIGKIAQLENRLGIMIRNKLMKMTPEKASVKQTEELFKLS